MLYAVSFVTNIIGRKVIGRYYWSNHYYSVESEKAAIQTCNKIACAQSNIICRYPIAPEIAFSLRLSDNNA